MIKCNDQIKNIINNKKTISDYKICHHSDDMVEILVMIEYNLGSIYDYEWNKNNFELLKNVIKQVIFSIINAYNKKGFIHGDLHSGNILLKPKRNSNIIYENKLLDIIDLKVVIMDFGSLKLNQLI